MHGATFTFVIHVQPLRWTPSLSKAQNPVNRHGTFGGPFHQPDSPGGRRVQADAVVGTETNSRRRPCVVTMRGELLHARWRNGLQRVRAEKYLWWTKSMPCDGETDVTCARSLAGKNIACLAPTPRAARLGPVGFSGMEVPGRVGCGLGLWFRKASRAKVVSHYEP